MDKENPPVAPAASQAPTPTPAQPENTIRVEGILDIDNSRNGQLLDLAKHGKRRPTDPFVPRELVRRFKLNQGSIITATATPDERFPNPKVRFIEKVDGLDLEARRRSLEFANLTTITPNEQIKLELKDGRMTNRVIDLLCPIGKGTRGLIVAPPRTGKTTLLRDMALGVLENNPECIVMILLVDERPEEVTDFRRSVPAEVWASSNDEQIENHLRIADLCIERAKRLVETGSRMDDVIFQEFKGTGNMELVLDRKCAEMRLWPAINIAQSGTRKEELLIDAKTLEGIHFFRRALVQQKIEEATEPMIARLAKTKTNAEFIKLIAR